MAPVVTEASWGAEGLVGFAALSLVILFILTITLLSLCASCQRQSFDLESNIPKERNSTLVRIVQLENATVAMNPVADIQKDEKEPCPLPEDGATEFIQGQDVKPWRNHEQEDNTKRAVNGSRPPTPHGDRSDTIVQRLNSIPTSPRPPVKGLNQRPVDQFVSTHSFQPELPYSVSSED